MDLYSLAPEEFTAARDAAVRRARAAGDRTAAKELAALRRPTVPAHLVNLLVRSAPGVVEELLELGAQLAQAQREGSGRGLRALGEQRRALVQAVTAQAVDLGGRDVTSAVRAEVEATLEAALADPAAGEAVRSGGLVRALSFAGFGGADLSGAVAVVPASPGSGSGSGPGPDAVAAADAAAREAAGRLDDAVRVLEQTHRDEDDAVDRVSQAVDAESEAEQTLAEARTARAQAELDSQQAQEAAARQADVVREAQDAAEQARAALDRLRRA